jgi:hypothetical protein
MNRQLRFSTVAAVVLAAGLAAPAGRGASFVYENEAEFTLSPDLDGDARPDLVVVDRLTGNYRIGYQTVNGSFTWADPRPGGMENVSGVTAGRLRTATVDALAITAPTGNRINVFERGDPNLQARPHSFFTPGTGPDLIVALDIGGGGDTAHDDLFVTSVWNGQTPFVHETMRNNGTQLTLLGSAVSPGNFARGNAVSLKSGTPLMAGVVERGAANDRFRVFDLGTGTPVEAVATTSSLPPGAEYVFGRFDPASPLSQFLFYQPGATGLFLRPVQEPASGSFALAAGPTFNLGSSMRQVFTFTQDSTQRLLILVEPGATARIYDFDGSTFPVPGQAFEAPAGEQFTSAAVLPDGQFVLFSGPSRLGDNAGTGSRSGHLAGHTWPAPPACCPRLRSCRAWRTCSTSSSSRLSLLNRACWKP